MMSKKFYFAEVFIALGLLLFISVLSWSVPMVIDYKDMLLDDNGSLILVTGDKDTNFSIYDAAIDGKRLWTEQQTVKFNDGYFRVELGTVTSIDPNLFDFNELYLEIFIPNIVTTRKALNSTPYAIKAKDADTLGGEDPFFYAEAEHTHTFAEFKGDSVTDAQVPDSITIDNARIAGFALKAGDANTVDGKYAHEFLDTSANTQTKTGGLNINGKVGIGTTTPQELLNIDSGGNFPVVIRGDANRSSENTVLLALQGYWNGTRVAGFDLQTGSDTVNKDGGMIKFRTAQDATKGLQDRLTIDEYGNVGIGTTTPQSLLNIDSGGDSPVVIRGDADRSSSGTVLLALQGYWNGTRVAGFDLQTGSDTVNKDAGRIKFRTAEDAQTGLQDRLVIDEFGNVGINTPSPTEKLEVTGTVKATAFIGDGASLTNIPLDTDWAEGGGNLYRETGNVGIGTRTPAAHLHVSGNSIMEGTLSINTYQSGTDILDQSQESKYSTTFIDNDWQSFTAGPDGILTRIEILSNKGESWGSVTLTVYEGEGTSGYLLYESKYDIGQAPQGGLIAFDIPIEAGLMLSLGSQYTFQIDTGFIWFDFDDPYSGGQSSLGSGRDIWFRTYVRVGYNPGGIVTVTENGYVGIGTTSPAGLLDVGGGHLIVDPNSGNVGIGTLAPSKKLEVAGRVVAHQFIGDGSGLTNITSAASADKATLALDSDTVDGVHASALEESAEIDNKIATHSTDPNAHHTKTTSFAELTNMATDAQIPDDITINFAASAGNAVSAGDADTVDGKHAYEFGDWHSLDAADRDPVDALYVDNAGNVGIGTTSPSEKLEVTGTVKATAFSGNGSALTNLPADADWTLSGANIYRNTGNVGIGVTGPTKRLAVQDDTTGTAIDGKTSSASGIGVYGEATNTGSYTNYGGYFKASGSNGWGAYGEASGSSGMGVFGYASNLGDVTNYGGYFLAAGSYGKGVYGSAIYSGDVTNYGGHFTAQGKGGTGVLGEASNPGDVTNRGGYFTAQGKYGTGVLGYAPGSYGKAVCGVGAQYDFYAGGAGTNYGPFTGAHEVKLSDDFADGVKPGMVVSVTGEARVRQKEDGTVSISSTLPTVKLSKEANDKAVLGVFVSEGPLPEEHWYKTRDGERFAVVNALGEGRVWVSNMNGDISAGDYITSSAIAGYGQKQDDDLLHSYTLAKAIETVDWNSVTDTVEINGKTYKVYLVAVVYTSG